MLESSMGFHPNAFSTAVVSVDNTPRWREQNGSIEGIIFNNRTAGSFRVFPLPKETKDLYEDKDDSLSTDSTSPQVNVYWHESLVWGALERAYLKESQQRNTEKSGFYRQKFLDNAGQASAMEGMTSGSLSEGRNQSGFRVNRNL